ncbi:MAG: minor capsid protein [Gemmatimonadota bacterium]
MADVQSYLQAQSLVDGETGWTSTKRHLHDDADQVVALTDDGGPPPEIATSSGLGDQAIADVGVQALVRAARLKADDSYDKAEAIRDALHGLTDTTLGATRYIRVRAMTSEPVFAGFDSNGRPTHTIAFRLLRSEDP